MRIEEQPAEGVEGQGTAKSLKVHVVGRIMTDQGEAGGIREPIAAGRTMVPGGTEGERSLQPEVE